MILVYLGLLHSHVSSFSATGETLDDSPHSLSWTDPLHEVGREEADSVATLALKNAGEHSVSI